MTFEKLLENYSQIKITMKKTRQKNRRDKNLLKLREDLYKKQDEIIEKIVSEKIEVNVDW
jgi:hypothetical protein